jgi:hypothetical protein
VFQNIVKVSDNLESFLVRGWKATGGVRIELRVIPDLEAFVGKWNH